MVYTQPTALILEQLFVRSYYIYYDWNCGNLYQVRWPEWMFLNNKSYSIDLNISWKELKCE